MGEKQLDFQLLFEESPEVLLVLLPDAPRYTMVGATRARLHATHLTREQTIGRGLFEVFPENPDAAGATGIVNLRASLDRVLATRAPDTLAVQKYDVHGPDGEFKEGYGRPTNIPVLSASGDVLYILHRVEDVTDLVRANHDLDAIIYSVSHDLRAPLRAIDGFSQAFRRDFRNIVDETGQRYLDYIASGVHQTSTLINSMLELARIGRALIQIEAVDLSALAASIVEELRQGNPDRSVAVDIEAGLLGHGDRRLLGAVLKNLIGNAWKFTGRVQFPRIEFGRSTADGSFFVRDNGAGFDMAHTGRLFAPFQRLHRSDEFEGTGVGLAIVHRVLQCHGGRIWFQAAVGQGATFFFSLPRKTVS